jgi:DNA-binding MarR family transcriptional regulator
MPGHGRKSGSVGSLAPGREPFVKVVDVGVGGCLRFVGSLGSTPLHDGFRLHLTIIVITSNIDCMAGKLKQEIRQTKDFASTEGEAALNVLRTAEVIQQKLNAVLKQFDLTLTQYNVLRILRGAGDQGITCSVLAERMIARDPDITRLLDRMERRGLVVRQRSADDRRVVLTMLHLNGATLLNETQKPMRNAMLAIMGRLGETRLLSLISSLEEVRANEE